LKCGRLLKSARCGACGFNLMRGKIVTAFPLSPMEQREINALCDSFRKKNVYRESVRLADGQQVIFTGVLREELPMDGCWANCVLASGDVYEGTLFGGLLTGKGVLRKANGEVLQGTFCNGRLNGKGQCFLANGIVYSGEYIDGRLTGEYRIYPNPDSWRKIEL